MITRILLGFVALSAISTMSAALICPTTANTNSDCGAIVTITSGNPVTIALVAGANPYDGADDVLVGVQNLSGSTFTGSFTVTGSGNGGGLFAFDGDGICAYTGLAYCATAATGYEGPLNTFSAIKTTTVFDDTGTVNITGLAAGGTTYFSLESAPSTINGGTGPGITGGNGAPEPATSLLFVGALGAGFAFARRRLRAAPPM